MPHITVSLSDAQARTLDERARAAQRPSDEILRDIVTRALDEGVGDLEVLDEAAVDQAFADFAAAYPDLCDALFASDPDLATEYDDGRDATDRSCAACAAERVRLTVIETPSDVPRRSG